MKPANLLFLLSDQHTRGALGCYGHPVVRTPHLDALAARGTRFSAACTPSPICVPARASLATGRYVHQDGYWDNAKPYEGSVPSWHHRLAANGHRVESIGKLHFRSERDPTGFDAEQLPMHVVGGMGDLLGAVRDGSATLSKYRGYIEEAGPGDTTYSRYDAQITEAAIEWLREAGKAPPERPWALFVSLVCPHPPIVSPAEFYDMYPPETLPWPALHGPPERPEHPADRDLRAFHGIEEPLSEDAVRRSMAAYFGLCSYLDANVGRILGALDESGLSGETRVLYTSDHGEMNGDLGMWGKCSMYEASLGVPMILAGEGVPEGAVVDIPTSLVDCFPSVLECVGLPLEDEDRHLRGESLLSLARGASPERTVFAEFHAAASCTASYMLRDTRFKYVHHVGYPDQLFDLEADPAGHRDLLGDPAWLATRDDWYQRLRAICDPEEVHRRARSDQLARLASAGGARAILERGSFGYTPAPGEAVRYA